MDGEVVFVREGDSERGVDGFFEGVNGGFFVVVFVAVGLVGGDLPSFGVEVDVEFGEFVFDFDAGESGLGREFITEGDAVVEGAETDSKEAFGAGSFGEVEGEFVVIVGDEMFFAPDGFPSFADGLFGGADDREVVAEGGGVFEFEAEFRTADESGFAVEDRVREVTLTEGDFDGEGAIGREEGFFSVGTGELVGVEPVQKALFDVSHKHIIYKVGRFF